VLITEVGLQETETTGTLEKSTPSGIAVPRIDNYDKIGEFNLDDLRVTALPSGFTLFDRHFLLKRGTPQLVTVAAYTSHGKTAMMMQIAAHVAKSGPVFVHSFEMSKKDLETRLIAGIANFSSEKIMRGEIPKDRLAYAVKEYKSRQLFLCKSSDSSINFIQTSCFEKAKEVGKPALIVIDYLQLMQSSVDRQQRTREIADCMRGLKTLAEQLECPILLGSQMNRGCEERGKEIEIRKGVGEYVPVIRDLAESSTIAHDSDVVIFITRQEQYDRTRPNEADILCVKNRSGQTFSVTLQWSGEICTFLDQEVARGL
jgi:replicative DNA helicase